MQSELKENDYEDIDEIELETRQGWSPKNEKLIQGKERVRQKRRTEENE